MSDPDIVLAIRGLHARITQANSQFLEWQETGEGYDEPSWLIESCFLQLIAITDALNLLAIRDIVRAKYDHYTQVKYTFADSALDPDGDPYSTVIADIRSALNAVQSFFPIDDKLQTTKRLEDIIRDIHYVIADDTIYGASPQDETDIHTRIEGVLKCVFPDLKHKPSLTKQIKNFQPDTGIPSLRTLIEYKFIDNKKLVPIVADQILADTRGYNSADWDYFIYVIYETKRFRKEKEWTQLLRDSGVSKNTSVIVLSGESTK